MNTFAHDLLFAKMNFVYIGAGELQEGVGFVIIIKRDVRLRVASAIRSSHLEELYIHFDNEWAKSEFTYE